MGSEPRQRVFLAARVAAMLIGVAIVLLLAARTRSNPQDTAAKATPSPTATHPTATHAAATHAVTRAPTNAPITAATSPVRVTAGRPLCQAVPSLVRFAIQVLGSPHQGGAINVSNAGTVTKAAQVRSLAGQFCALAAEPGDCRASEGSWFQLIFAAADGEFWTVWADNGGCEQVIGVGDQTRTALSAGPGLWPALLADLRGAQPLTP